MTQPNRQERLARQAKKPEIIARMELHGWRFVTYYVAAGPGRSFSMGEEGLWDYGDKHTWPLERIDPWVVPNKNFWALANRLMKESLI